MWSRRRRRWGSRRSSFRRWRRRRPRRRRTQRFARIAGASEVATGAGLGFAYHNHDFEFRVLEDGSDLWGRIAASGLPQEPDVGWLLVAGRDPVTVLGELAGRCPLVHAKDVRRKADGT